MKIKIGDKVQLTGRTAKGKQRIKQWGGEGEIIKVSNSVQFSQQRGLWLLISAADPCSRWILFQIDKDFEITIL